MIVGRHEIDIEAVVARMSRHFGVEEDVVRVCAEEVAGRFSDARIGSFLPILVEREVRDILRRAGFGRGVVRVAEAEEPAAVVAVESP